MANTDSLRKHLDGLARRGARYLRRYALKEAVEWSMRHVHLVALVVPAVFVVCVAIERFAGNDLWVLSPIVTVLVALVAPVAYVLIAGALGFALRPVNRTYSLALFDRELGYKDRLQTADEFLRSSDLTPFELASVEDAIPYAEKATNSRLQDIRIATPTLYTGKWGHGVAAVLLLGAGMFISFFVFNPQVEASSDPDELIALATPEVLPPVDEVFEAPQDSRDEVTPPTHVPSQTPKESVVVESTPAESTDSPLGRANPSDSNPKQSVQMGLSAGMSQDNKTGSAASNLSGQANPDKKKKETKSEPPKEQESKESKSAIDKEQPKDESATGIAGGKGTSAGRQASSTDVTESLNKTDQDDLDTDVDLESDDEEDEEQEAANAARPMINQRKAAVDRRLSPSGMMGQEENEQNNGRGGASGRKKTRGVAAMLLGVPQPDQLRSQINPGRVKIQRERAVPHPSEADTVASESRGEIDESIGKVARHELKPWMRNVVSNYFLAMREPPTEEEGE
ncbi:MAG: hypothetical protein OXG08_02435 [Gammaproteobacteria bacterium]|nr:hypothetical protein [Gammaproteobacteria bacterium]